MVFFSPFSRMLEKSLGNLTAILTYVFHGFIQTLKKISERVFYFEICHYLRTPSGL